MCISVSPIFRSGQLLIFILTFKSVSQATHFEDHRSSSSASFRTASNLSWISLKRNVVQRDRLGFVELHPAALLGASRRDAGSLLAASHG
jgi:hypothetical protein